MVWIGNWKSTREVPSPVFVIETSFALAGSDIVSIKGLDEVGSHVVGSTFRLARFVVGRDVSGVETTSRSQRKGS